jgi:hypothetical protein
MAKRGSKKQQSPSPGDPRRRHPAKPKETPPIYYPHEWAKLTDAFVEVMARVGQRDLTRSCLIRDLRSGDLGSMKILPDGTMTLLNHSDWQQRTVEAPMHPQEGVRVDPYLDAHVYVQLVDLDKLYLRAGTPVAPQSNDTESSPGASPVRHLICCGIALSWSGMYVNFWRTKSAGSRTTTSPFIGNWIAFSLASINSP